MENTKRVMLIKGGQTSEVVSQALKDIVSVFMTLRAINVFIALKTSTTSSGCSLYSQFVMYRGREKLGSSAG